MSARVELEIDVTEAAGLGEPARIAMTVVLPEPDRLGDAPVVCFGKPGGGYARGYFTCDLPGPAKGAQADWHAERGWIFVAVDHLGVGASSLHDGARLDYATLAAAADFAERELLRRLATGELTQGFPLVARPLRLGIGQSMGGCLTVVQQGRHASYDGVGVLGYGVVHTQPPTRPGTPPLPLPWLPRDTLIGPPAIVLNAEAVERATREADVSGLGSAMAWGFHWDDVDPAIVARDLAHYDRGLDDPSAHEGHDVPPWASTTLPGAVALTCATPGIVAPEAAAITVPVLLAMGERDVVVDPPGEIRAYRSASSLDLFVCPRMAHMHNFAGTRELFWKRIATWAEWVREMTRA